MTDAQLAAVLAAVNPHGAGAGDSATEGASTVDETTAERTGHTASTATQGLPGEGHPGGPSDRAGGNDAGSSGVDPSAPG